LLQAQDNNLTKLSGTLLDETNTPVEFANIVLLSAKDNSVVFGGISDQQGQFMIEASNGEYTLRISVMGFENIEREYLLQEHTDLGRITLNKLSIELREVSVQAQRIIRSADRFIINIPQDETIIGKSANDLLAYSPGVFIQESNGSISINGKTGTKVIVNERILHEQGQELIQYLQTLKAEDILRIEVLPSTGAEYDANMTGGVIKIKLRRQREDGMRGSVGTQFSFAPSKNDVFSLNPYLNLNYKNNRVSIYTSLNYSLDHSLEETNDEVLYKKIDKTISGNSDLKNSNDGKRLRIGGIYNIDSKQSIGVEFNGTLTDKKNRTNSSSQDFEDGNLTYMNSLFKGKRELNRYAISGNYILELDSLGSIFKFLFDYVNNRNINEQNYNSKYIGSYSHDSIYRNNINTNNHLYVLNADIEKKITSMTTLRVGLKYSRSTMDNGILFDYQNSKNEWHAIDPLSSNNTFKENVFAIYAAFTSEFKDIINYNIGLRGEYTYASPWTNKIEIAKKQKYFKIFPTVNILFYLNKDHTHSIVLNYNKKIRRPTFGDLNPYRLPLSEYSYTEGNPYLKPAYSNDWSASLVLFNKYNLTAGVTSTKDAFSRIASSNPNDNNTLILRPENVAKNTDYYVNLNLPIELFSWWKINVDILGARNIIKVLADKDKIYTFQGGLENAFLLPGKTSLQVDGYYVSPSISGNIKMLSAYKINSSLRKSFFNNKITASIFIYDIFNSGRVKVRIKEQDFNESARSQWGHRELGFSIRYNFKTGKSIQLKNIESGAEEERSRL